MNTKSKVSDIKKTKQSWMKTLPFLALTLLLLGACSSSGTDYVVASEQGDYGYSERKLTETRYRVSFTGNSRTPVEVVQDYALLRAAELTVQKNHDWFEVADRSTTPQVEPDSGAGVEVVTASPTHTRCGLLGCSTTRYSPAFTVDSGDFPRRRQRYTASIEVVMGSGANANSAQAYKAREVIESVRAEI